MPVRGGVEENRAGAQQGGDSKSGLDVVHAVCVCFLMVCSGSDQR